MNYASERKVFFFPPTPPRLFLLLKDFASKNLLEASYLSKNILSWFPWSQNTPNGGGHSTRKPGFDISPITVNLAIAVNGAFEINRRG